MGLNCAPILADLTMALLEFQNKQIFEGLFIVRYLGDLLILGEENAISEPVNPCQPRAQPGISTAFQILVAF